MESNRSPARKARDLEEETGTRGSSREYFYLPLADALKLINVKVNLFAAVSEIREPKRSRGTDYVLTLKIRDQSYSAPGLSVNFFAESTKKFPHVRSTGDIISLHHVVMKIHNGEFYCVFNKRFSSFALFEGKATENFTAYQASIEYKATDHDNEFVLQLRTWLLNYPHGAVLNEYSLQLNRIKTGLVFDLVCKVLHLCETSNGDRVLFVWDGTDTPPLRFTMEMYDDRITSKPKGQPYMSFPQPSYITDTDFRHAAFATLMDSLTYPEVTHRCKCIVRVVAAYPWRAEDLRSPVDGHYRIRLTLEDPTTRIHAYVYREDGEIFFGGYPTNEELNSKMNMLLGVTDNLGQVRATRDPPWICCCLKSYFLDKSNPWGTRRYQIFGTQLAR